MRWERDGDEEGGGMGMLLGVGMGMRSGWMGVGWRWR